MWTIDNVLLAGVLGGLRLVLGQMDEQKFFFYWPTETTQCQVSETLLFDRQVEGFMLMIRLST